MEAFPGRLHLPLHSTITFARKVIRRFDADVRPADKKIIFKDFANVDTDCRIIVATVSLDMGMDISDVKRVVQFGIPLATASQISDSALEERCGSNLSMAGYKALPICSFHTGFLTTLGGLRSRSRPQGRDHSQGGVNRMPLLLAVASS